MRRSCEALVGERDTNGVAGSVRGVGGFSRENLITAGS